MKSTRLHQLWHIGSTFLLVFVAYLLLVIPAKSHAAEDDFIRGYVSAFLKYRTTSDDLIEVDPTSTSEVVALIAHGCVSKAERQRVEEELRETGFIDKVRWREEGECSQEGTVSAHPQKDEDAELFAQPLPFTPVFEKPIADPRTPQFSLSYQSYRTSRGEFNAGVLSAGETFPFLQLGESSLGAGQVSLEGAIFSLFNLDGESKDLINSDFIFGVPLTFRTGALSTRIRYYHQSSHLGDEFILSNPDVKRVNLSFEDIELLVSGDYRPFRLYGGGSIIVRSEPDLDPFRVQGGVEIRFDHVLHDAGIILAADYQGRQELDWELEESYILGLTFQNKADEAMREARFVAEYFEGPSRNGQFYREHVSYWGLGLQLDF